MQKKVRENGFFLYEVMDGNLYCSLLHKEKQGNPLIIFVFLDRIKQVRKLL